MTFTVATRPAARIAISAAQHCNLDCVLLSPENAAASMGVPWWLALQKNLETDAVSDARAEQTRSLVCVLDCGANAGYAVSALGWGLETIILSAACPQRDAAALLATSLGAELWLTRPASLCVTARMSLPDVVEGVRRAQAGDAPGWTAPALSEHTNPGNGARKGLGF